MAVRLFAMTCGWPVGPLGAFLEGERGRIRVPVPCSLVEHPKGRLLFDSGLHVDTQRDTGGRLGIAAQVYDVEFEPGEEIASRLAALDVDPTSVPHDCDLGHDVLLLDGERDVFGDGSVVCVPTPGHTPGHQSLRIALDAGPIVLAADACYLRRSLEALHLPPIVDDRERMLESLERAGARIVYGHDPEHWAAMPMAPLEVR